MVILVLWSNLKTDLNLVDEMVYMQGLAARGIELPKAFGHKPKQKALADAKTPQDNRNKQAVPKKEKPQVDKKRSPRSDTGDALCVADLLNHYGSSQQIACEVPCKYPHYNTGNKSSGNQKGSIPSTPITTGRRNSGLLEEENRSRHQVQIGKEAAGDRLT